MKGLFKGLTSLESIKLQNIHSSKVISMESMFENCTSLESVDLSEIDITSLINMNNLFSGCSSLKVIDFSNLNMENITSSSNIFNGLTNFEYIILTNTKLSDQLFSELKDILNDKFYNTSCSLTEIIQNGDYKCCDSSGEIDCLQCSENKIIFYDKISSVSSKKQLYCGNFDISKCYAKEYGTKCELAIPNCKKCSDEGNCTKCEENYAIIDNISNECKYIKDKYYYDPEYEAYKLCSFKMTNCENCLFEDYFSCSNCQTNYTIKRENYVECVEKLALINNKQFYTNDSGINYYSCKYYNDINNCDECSNSNSDKWEKNYEFYNNNTICAKLADIDNNLYVITNGSLVACSSLIEDCNKCNDDNTCFECKDGSGLTKNNNCINISMVEEKHDYYKDENNIFISCLTLDHFLTCISSSVCTSCQEGFTLNINQYINSEEKEDGGLSIGAIMGIVFGFLLFLLITRLILYLIK